VDRNQAVGRINTMEELVIETVVQPRFRAELIDAFAGLCAGAVGGRGFRSANVFGQPENACS
jgi:hypothetical protein